MQREITLVFEEFSSLDDLNREQQELARAAIEARNKAYAPYSRFNVGAAVALASGKIESGSNKENASFPAGTCAERNVLNYVHDRFPGDTILKLAISAHPETFEVNEPLAPCGICRQVICEVEKIQDSPIEIIMLSNDGRAVVVGSGKDLLPLHFYLPQLKK